MSQREQDFGPHPIRRWNLQNFKSVEGAELELAPLTVLVGANSSGKSSLIQSMLLISQAAQAGPDAVLPLNGPLVELGDFRDVYFAGRPDRTSETESATRKRKRHFQIGAAVDLTASDASRRPIPYLGLSRGSLISWSASFGGREKDKGLGAARLNQVSLELKSNRGEGEQWSFETTGARRQHLEVLRSGMYFGGQGEVLPLKGVLSISLANKRTRNRRRSRSNPRERITTAGLAQMGGIPTQLFEKVGLLEVKAREHLERVIRMAARRAARLTEAELDEKAVKRLVELTALEIVSLMDLDDQDALQATIRMSDEHVLFLANLPGYQAEQIVKKVVRSVGGSKESVLAQLDLRTGHPYGLNRLGFALASFFARGVLYLGPLREDPKVVYVPTPSNREGNVGKKGEKTVAILHRNGSDEIECPYPDRPAARCTLAEGVAFWLKHLGLAEGIDTELRVRLGLEPHLKIPNVERALDMTAVGVGVSQILPVLVMGLHSEPGSVLLMEQPELHLHPALQQRLGDFLLACARSGRQLIVETHSDHMVSRLRRRIAEDKTNAIGDNVALVFAERKEGRTGYRRVDVNRYGALEEWPEDFFDQAAKESQMILRAGLAKMRQEEEAGSD